MNAPNTAPLILASSSPRRRELLEEAGFPHRVVAPLIDDAQLNRGRVSPTEWVVALAHLKARAVIEALPDRANSLVLAADTLVFRGDRVLGKPNSPDDAAEMIRFLRGRTHQVATAVAYDPGTGIQWLADAASVTFGDIPDRDLHAYIRTDDWQGKAGGYNLYERIDDGWPVTFEGDPTTIIGLPMRKLTPILEQAMWDRQQTPGAS
jgi:septum formation protein